MVAADASTRVPVRVHDAPWIQNHHANIPRQLRISGDCIDPTTEDLVVVATDGHIRAERDRRRRYDGLVRSVLRRVTGNGRDDERGVGDGGLQVGDGEGDGPAPRSKGYLSENERPIEQRTRHLRPRRGDGRAAKSLREIAGASEFFLPHSMEPPEQIGGTRLAYPRSEERRVGEEGRSRWAADH